MKRTTWHLLGAASALLITVAPRSGGLEVDCINGVEVTERWPAGTTSIPWQITFTTSGVQNFWTGPSSPPLNGAWQNVPIADKPGVGSLRAAAWAWNEAIVPDAVDRSGEVVSRQGGRAISIAFAEPTFVSRTVGSFIATSLRRFADAPPTCCGSLQYLEIQSASIADTLRFDSANTVDFVQSGEYWRRTLGLPLNALAVCAVRAINGVITEFDIGFNDIRGFWGDPQTQCLCVEYSAFIPFSWLYDSRFLGRVAGHPGGSSYTPIPGGPTHFVNWPTVGFADVQGVATHEFGHALGLGHAFLDANSTLSSTRSPEPTHFPTMFPNAQSAALSQSYIYGNPSVQQPGQTAFGPWNNSDPLNPLTWPPSSAALETNPRTLGILGFTARTLELDDIAAIGRGYPTAAFASRVGGVSGGVTHGGQPYLGAMLTLMSVDHPNTVRASTLSRAGGKFDLTGVPPGRYVLRVEPFPRGMLNVPSAWPSYIAGSCGVSNQDFPAEFWNQADAANEISSAVSVISVSAGVTSPANFVLDAGPVGSFRSPVLTVVNATTTGPSPLTVPGTFQPNRRHMEVNDAQAAATGSTQFDVELRIDGAPAYANGTFVIVASRRTELTVSGGQVTTVTRDPSIQPVVFAGTLSAAGAWTGTVPVDVRVARGRENVQFEAQVLAPNQQLAVTNSISAWFAF